MSSTNSSENLVEYLQIFNGNYSIEPESLAIGKKQATKVRFSALILSALIAIVAVITMIFILLLRVHVKRYDLSSRTTIAHIGRNSYRGKDERNEFENINIAISNKAQFDHLSVHNSLFRTGRR